MAATNCAGSASAPRLTVCIPTHRRSRLLARTLRSVLGQTLRDFEVYVSDNAADAETVALVGSFDDARVHYSPDETAAGLTANLNRCLQLGTAPLVTIVHDDDLLEPDGFERKLALLDRHPEMAFVHTGIRYIRDDDSVMLERVDWTGLTSDTVETSAVFLDRALRAGNRVCFSTAVFRRRVARLVRFEAADGEACDFGFWIRASTLGSVGFLHDRLASMRIHPGSISAREVHEGDDGIPAMNLRLICLNRDVKLRFAAAEAEPPRALAYRRLAARATRQQLCVWVLKGGPSPVTVLGRIRQALRTEPSLWWLPRTVLEAAQAIARHGWRRVAGGRPNRRPNREL